MPRLYIQGGKTLCGDVRIHGSKNGALPILAATLVTGGECVINNCPDISDVHISLKILKNLGCECSFENGTAYVNSSFLNSYTVPENLMCEMRSSVIFLGALLSRCGIACITDPGGCDLGPRPIDLHISSLEKLGGEFTSDNLYIYCKGKHLKGAEIYLPISSVGATENIILASVKAKGKTVIRYAAAEPEIVDLANFLNKCGAKIYGAGTNEITIYGVDNLHGAIHTVMPDRIEACTYLSAFAATHGNGEILNVLPCQIKSFTDLLEKMGCTICKKENSVRIFSPEKLNSFGELKTGVYPAFPTDAGPLAVALGAVANGNCRFTETVFEKRFAYLPQLVKMGAQIENSGNSLFVRAVNKLHGEKLECSDLRAGAALTVAALSACGETELGNIKYIDRGYEKIENNLSAIGADVKRI